MFILLTQTAIKAHQLILDYCSLAWKESGSKIKNHPVEIDCWHEKCRTRPVKTWVEIVYLPGCLVSRRCGSVSLGRPVHPQSCRCQLGWEAGRPSPLPQSEGSTEAATSCTPAITKNTHTQIYLYVYQYKNISTDILDSTAA